MIKLFFQTISQYRKTDSSMIAASIAYYSLFAIVSLFVVILIIISQVFGPQTIDGRLAQSLRSVVDENTFLTVQTAIFSAYEHINHRGIGLISFAIMLWSIFSWSRVLQTSFAKVTQTKFKQINFIHQIRAFFTVILLGIFLTLFSTDAAISWIIRWIVPDSQPFFLFSTLHIIAGFIFLWVTLTLLYMSIFPQKISLRSYIVGSFATSIILILGRIFIEIIIYFYSFPLLFGTAAAVVIYLYWLYYLAQILLLGIILILQIDKS